MRKLHLNAFGGIFLSPYINCGISSKSNDLNLDTNKFCSSSVMYGSNFGFDADLVPMSIKHTAAAKITPKHTSTNNTNNTNIIPTKIASIIQSPHSKI